MLNLLLASAAFLPQGPGISTAPVVINEFVYDDGGVDNYEFVELYNRMSVPVDISGWKIVNNDPISVVYGGTGTGQVHLIPAGTILAPGGFYLLGNIALVPVAVPGVSQILPLNAIENGGGAGVFTDPESIELQDVAGTIIDSVVIELGYYGPGTFGPAGLHPIEGRGFFGDLGCGDGTVLPACSIARAIDGWDNNVNQTDFLVGFVATPGLSNTHTAAMPYLETFDGGVTPTPIPGWAGGFVQPKFVDPTVVDSQNLNAKPASPQGGLAMSVWDTTGGGNSVYLDIPPVTDVVVETYVYIQPTMLPVNPSVGAPYTIAGLPAIAGTYNVADGEWWAVGVRGCAASNGNPPNIPGNYYSQIALGVGTRQHFVSGIAWAHFRTPTQSSLFLVDMKDGPNNPTGTNFTVLAGPISIAVGVNDGWQRIRLHVQGNHVVGNFGGTYGYDDGLRIAATTTTNNLGQVYIAYREAILHNVNGTAGCNPPLFDLFDVHAPTTAKLIYGTGSPTTVATPNINSNGLAIQGSTGFAITGTGMIPFGAPNYAFCAVVLGFSSFAPGYPIPGTQPTLLAYPLPILTSTIGFADATGAVSFPFGLPLTPAFNGVTIVSQLVDFDPFLAFALPVGTSAGMDCLIGN